MRLLDISHLEGSPGYEGQLAAVRREGEGGDGLRPVLVESDHLPGPGVQHHPLPRHRTGQDDLAVRRETRGLNLEQNRQSQSQSGQKSVHSQKKIIIKDFAQNKKGPKKFYFGGKYC